MLLDSPHDLSLSLCLLSVGEALPFGGLGWAWVSSYCLSKTHFVYLQASVGHVPMMTVLFVVKYGPPLTTAVDDEEHL